MSRQPDDRVAIPQAADQGRHNLGIRLTTTQPDGTSPHQGRRVLDLAEVARTMSAPPTLGQRDRPRHFRNPLPDRHDALPWFAGS
jgi:hypothetical protein